MKKKITIIFMAIIIIYLLTSNTCVLASVTWGEIESQAGSFLGMASNVPNINVQPTVVSVGQILTTIGMAVVLVGILILGIKYMLATPEEAAKIKGQLLGLVISAIVIFGAWQIWSIIVGVLQGLD